MSSQTRSDFVLSATGAVCALLAVVFCLGGAWLLWRGGSAYYLVSGAGLLLCAWLIRRAHRDALFVAAALLLFTLAWSVWEVRFDWWQLLPRNDLLFALCAWLLLPGVNRRLRMTRTQGDGTATAGNGALWAALATSIVLALFSLSKDYYTLDGAWQPRAGADAAKASSSIDWTAYGGSGYGDRFAAARQITPENVKNLKVAWEFHTGDFKGAGDPGEIANEVTPLKANGKLYLCTPHNLVIALDPDSGKELWRFDPHINRDAHAYQHMICRGVAYYDATAAGDAASGPAHAAAVAACPRRIYAPTADGTVVAVNADTGQPCTGFGEQGAIDLKVGEGTMAAGTLNPTSPPLVTAHVLVAAASVTDNDSTDEPSGVVRGYDIDSGKLLWNWDSGNPEETTPLPPGRTYVRNSPNMWSVASADEALGLVYLPMGNQTPDIWGGNRIPAGEHYNSAIVALDVATGKVRWVYQTVHHDLWDMDIGGQPSLVDIDTPRGKVPALIASTKRGDLYVLDRRDGSLVVPAPEQPVPQGAAEGDRTSPTQPFSALSYKPGRKLAESDMWGTSPIDQMICRIIFKGLRYDGIFTPPSEQGSIVYPGNYGVFDWGGVAVDPERQVMIANPNYMAFVSRLHRRDKIDVKGGSGTEQGLQPMTGTPFARLSPNRGGRSG